MGGLPAAYQSDGTNSTQLPAAAVDATLIEAPKDSNPRLSRSLGRHPRPEGCFKWAVALE
jgi:hypothetical protein